MFSLLGKIVLQVKFASEIFAGIKLFPMLEKIQENLCASSSAKYVCIFEKIINVFPQIRIFLPLLWKKLLQVKRFFKVMESMFALPGKQFLKKKTCGNHVCTTEKTLISLTIRTKIRFTVKAMCFHQWEICFHHWQGRVSQDKMCFCAN